MNLAKRFDSFHLFRQWCSASSSLFSSLLPMSSSSASSSAHESFGGRFCRKINSNILRFSKVALLYQRFNLYIICLAFTDLAVGLLLPLSSFRGIITIHSTAVCDLLNSTIIFSINASIYIFVGLNLDRLHAIIRPLKYKSETKRWTTAVSLFLAFLVALICSVPFWVWHHKMPQDGCFCQYPGFTDVSALLF